MQKSIRVELTGYRIQVSEYDEVVRTIRSFSMGRDGHRTPVFNGSLSLTKRRKNHTSSKYPPPHGGAKMPYSLFFEQHPACAFHAGDPAVPSHGCIHLALNDARWLFDWAGSSPVGLAIAGPYPASPVAPQRLYRVGAPNMLNSVVRAIQAALTAAGFPTPVTGDFTVETDEATRAFQAAKSLVVDGIVGRTTADALGVAI